MTATAESGSKSSARRVLRLVLVSLLCIAPFLTPRALGAESESAPSIRWGGSLSVTNDYVYRGVSLSQEKASVQGSLHAGVGAHFNVGVFAATVENERTGSTEAELSGSISGVWRPHTDWTVRGAWSHFIYTGPAAPSSYDYDEFNLSAAFRSYAVLGVAWMPNAQGFNYTSGRRRGDAAAIDLTGAWPIADAWSIAIGAGYYDVSKLHDAGYAYWHAGTTGTVGPVEIDLLYIGSDHRARQIYGKDVTGTRWSAAIRWRF